MGFVKCYDVAKMVIDEATKRFGIGYCVSDESEDSLISNCRMIDILAERFDGESYEVNVDEETTDITITLVCNEFEVGDSSDEFYRITEQAKQVIIKPCDPNSSQIQLDFVFDGIWRPII